MKKGILFFIFLLSGFLLQAQDSTMTDLSIAKKLVSQDYPSVKDALNSLGLTFQMIKEKSRKASAFVEGSKNNMKKWEFEMKRGDEKDTKRITDIIIYYDMRNGGDFFDLHQYNEPPKKEMINGRRVKFKLSRGKKESTLEVMVK
ncbi:hypothetical protein LA303_10465 [Candidatus Sulfidibacterium hydrothermale]|uniref:hypothetical protein n=1 Tax=Candidatus Sulfidibacterium hydrothermale TaxID=2875962 RepID=UPI001F0AD4B9|nr:hypothetical protein [Candidatus Sulfidibacterium hydrothermale]UBM61828.1 hypothetical protein LA303_10465 [Candidatus Sulfidibacterium hydrothermale]